MTVFQRLWDISAFRTQFREFSQLAAEDQADVIRLVASGEILDQPPTDQEDARTKAARRLRTLVETLVRIRTEFGLQPLTEDILALAGEDAQPVVAALQKNLPEDANERDRRSVERAQESVLPVLVNMGVDVDFRAVQPYKGETTLAQVVPVLIVRLTFDEPIGGSESIVFQVTDDHVDDLIGLLRSAEKVRRTLLQQLPKNMVPSSVRPSLLEEWQ